jgi:hypothetical protein
VNRQITSPPINVNTNYGVVLEKLGRGFSLVSSISSVVVLRTHTLRDRSMVDISVPTRPSENVTPRTPEHANPDHLVRRTACGGLRKCQGKVNGAGTATNN